MTRSVTVLPACAFALALLAPPASAGWPINPATNLPLSTASGDQSAPLAFADASARTVMMWTDFNAGNAALRAQAVTAYGDPLWTTNGALVCGTPEDQRAARMASDGTGGMIAVWVDDRGGVDQVYAQRLSSAGTPLWTADGIAVAPDDSAEADPALIPFGSGGVVVVWTDRRDGSDDIRAQILGADGNALWPAGGVVVCGDAGAQNHPRVVAGGGNRAIVTWFDDRGGFYAQRLDADGQPMWTVNGVLCAAANEYVDLAAISNGRGGAILSWTARAWLFDANVYAQRVDSLGAVLWGAGGVAVCTKDWNQRYPMLAGDGALGAIVAWDDLRTFHLHEIYAQRVDSLGAVKWTADGNKVTTLYVNQRRPAIASDGDGGAVLAWADERNGAPDVFAQRLDAAGVAVWSMDGVAVSTAPDTQTTIALAGDGAGGAIVAWSDHRSGADWDIYAQRVLPNGNLGIPLSVDPPRAVPDAWLDAPVPNPVVEGTSFRFGAGRASRVSLTIHDQLGRRVRTLLSSAAGGAGALYWDGRDDEGRLVPSGVYFCRMVVDGRTLSRRFVTIR